MVAFPGAALDTSPVPGLRHAPVGENGAFPGIFKETLHTHGNVICAQKHGPWPESGGLHRQRVHLSGCADEAVPAFPVAGRRLHVADQPVNRHLHTDAREALLQKSSDGVKSGAFHIDGDPVSRFHHILHSRLKKIRRGQKVLRREKQALGISAASRGFQRDDAGNLLRRYAQKILRFLLEVLRRGEGNAAKPLPVAAPDSHTAGLRKFSPVKWAQSLRPRQKLPERGRPGRADEIPAAGLLKRLPAGSQRLIQPVSISVHDLLAHPLGQLPGDVLHLRHRKSRLRQAFPDAVRAFQPPQHPAPVGQDLPAAGIHIAD